MKFTAITSALLLSLTFVSYADAHKDNRGHHDRPNHGTWARVVDVEPVYEWTSRRVPEQHCRIETVAVHKSSHKRNRSRVAGAVIGGSIGHAVGRKHSNQALGTAVGALIGVAVGDDIARKKGHRAHIEYRDVEHCEVKHVRKRHKAFAGYDVVYRLRGRLYRTHMDHHPGKRIRVSPSHTKFHSKRHW